MCRRGCEPLKLSSNGTRGGAQRRRSPRKMLNRALSRARTRVSPPANRVSCATERQPSTTCERSGPRARSGARSAAGAMRKAQSSRRAVVVARYGRAPFMTPAPRGRAPPSASRMRPGPTRGALGAERRPRRVVAPLGRLRPRGGRRTAPRRGSPLGVRLGRSPASAGPDRRDAEPRGALTSGAERAAAERVGVRLDSRPGQLPGPAAHAALEHAAPAGSGAPVALAGRGHRCDQVAGISAPRRYRSR